MSEITTGAVPLSSIGTPVTFSSVCKSAGHFIEKLSNIPYQNMLDEIENTNNKLKWLDSNMKTSPQQIMFEAKELQKMVASDNAFKQLTKGMNEYDKQIISGVIATQNSPLKNYTPRMLEEMPKSDLIFLEALNSSVNSLAKDNFSYVRKIVEESAFATGFNIEAKVLKQSNELVDLVFVDEKSRRFSAYCKMDKEMNPLLTLDLEGFACNENECSEKMSEIVRYLQEHGVPFHYQRLKHNQPQGILRELLKKQTSKSNENSLKTYLTNPQNSITKVLVK